MHDEEYLAGLKAKFLKLVSGINRDGIDVLMDWLEKSDFYTAPASTKFHGCYRGGLLEHSINVYEELKGLVELHKGTIQASNETLLIVSLFHDLCKVNCYKPGFRNVKNEDTGQWERVPTYSFEDKLPYGHGEKSVYIISGFMRLSREEAMAIRWHMGAWMDGEMRDAGNAFGMYPLAALVHLADMAATYLLEA